MTQSLFLLLTGLGVLAPPPADTLVELRRGDRVVVENLTGDIAITTWDRDFLEVREDDGDVEVAVTRSGAIVQIGYDGARRRRGSVDATIRVPAWVSLEISSRSLDLSIRGVDGSLDIGTLSGDIVIEDAGGPIDVRAIEGEIRIEDARAGVRASSQSDDVTMSRISGPIEVHSGDGDIQLIDIESESVRAETQDGDIRFSGSISDQGIYGFFVHDGDALIAVPTSMNARVRVSTFDGEFESEFPVRLERYTGGREFTFEVGDGSATLQIEVFDGEIRLLQRR